MADNPSIQDGRDRAKISGSEQYEVQYFAQKHGISTDRARDIIKQAGNNRARADELAGEK